MRCRLVWALYIVCTAGHLIANYKALKSLQLESLNNARLLYCLKEFLSKGTVLPLKTVNDLESVVLGTGVKGNISNDYFVLYLLMC